MGLPLHNLILLILTLSCYACTDDDLAFLPVNVIEGGNELCVYAETLDTSVQHAHYFEPPSPLTPDSIVAFKGANRWVAVARFIDRDSFVTINSTAIWRGEETLDGSRDILGFGLPADLVPGCYPLSDANDAWKQGAVSVAMLCEDIDVLISKYRLDTTAVNQFEILPGLENDPQKLRARFMMTLMTDTPYPPFTYEEMRFTNGYVRVGY